jgi:hypothetical protein
MNNNIADSLLLKLVYAQTVHAILNGQEMSNWLMLALFVESKLTNDPSLTGRVSGDLLTEGQAVKWVYKQVPCKCLRSLLKTKFKQDLKAGFCFTCKLEMEDQTKLMQCAKCRATSYCSRECQAADWPSHKPVCKLTQGYYKKKVEVERKEGETSLDARLSESMARAEQEQELREELDKARRELFWCCGVDPDQYDDPNCEIVKKIFYQHQLEHALPQVKAMSPEDKQWRAEYQQALGKARNAYERLPLESQELMNEAFALLDINDDDEAGYHSTEFNSAEKATERVKNIISCGAEGFNVNLLDADKGQSLLFRLCSNYRLPEESTGQVLDLVKFLLTSGADPNVENAMDKQTAFDHLDQCTDLEHASAENLGIYDVLKAAGAKLMPTADTGVSYGERGDPEYVGWLDQDRAKRKKAEE